MARESHWIAAGEFANLPLGAGRVLKHDGHPIALFRNDDGGVYAVDNACPHEGYPLAQGVVKGCILTCAWHNYEFDLRDGGCIMGDEAVRSYPTRVVSGMVEVDVTDPEPGDPAVLRLLFFAANFIHRARPRDFAPAERMEPAPIASPAPVADLASAIADGAVERGLGLAQG